MSFRGVRVDREGRFSGRKELRRSGNVFFLFRNVVGDGWERFRVGLVFYIFFRRVVSFIILVWGN